MRGPFRRFTRFTTSTVLGLLVIITILLGCNFRSAEDPKAETLEREQSVVHKVRGELQSTRDKAVKDLPSPIPQLETPLNLLADCIKPLGLEIRNKLATRQKLHDDQTI